MLQIAHLVGHDPQGLPLHIDGNIANPHRVQRPGVLLAQKVSLVKKDLAGGGVRHRVDQLIARHPLPERELLIELVPAHGGQIVAPGVKEEVVHQGFGGLHRGGSPGRSLR